MPEHTPYIDIAESNAPSATVWARRLRVSPSTITRWCLAGDLEHTRVGRELRITPRAMEACLAGRTESRVQRNRNAGAATNRAARSAELNAELSKI